MHCMPQDFFFTCLNHRCMQGLAGGRHFTGSRALLATLPNCQKNSLSSPLMSFFAQDTLAAAISASTGVLLADIDAARRAALRGGKKVCEAEVRLPAGTLILERRVE